MGCRFAANNIEISQSMIDFLNGSPFLESVFIAFHICLSRQMYVEKAESMYMGLSSLGMVLNESDRKLIHHVYGWFSVGLLDFFYIYSKNLTNANFPGICKYHWDPWVLFETHIKPEENLTSTRPQFLNYQQPTFNLDDYLSRILMDPNVFKSYA